MKRLMAAYWQMVTVVALLVSCTGQGIEVKKGGRAKGEIVTVDKSGDAGLFVSIDVDSNDSVHLVYYDRKSKSLKYAKQSADRFVIETVDDTCNSCLYACIRVTEEGEPHLAYYSDATTTLTYAYRKDGFWRKESVEWGRGTGMGTRLLFDENRRIHALYYSGDGYLKHAWRVLRKEDNQPSRPMRSKKGQAGESIEKPEGIWGNERVDKANGSEQVRISFVRQPKGGLAVSYLHWSGMNSELRIAVQGKDGSWSTEVVATENNPGKSSALIYAAAGEPQIIFREARKNRLSMARFSTKGWSITPLLEEAYNLALVSKAPGDLVIALEELSGADPRKGHLCLARGRGGVWTRYDVDPEEGTGTHLDAAAKASGSPIIAYYEERGRSLRLFLGE